MTPDATLHERPAELLAHLLRFDTTNPPGAERACVEWIDDLLRGAGIETRLLAGDPERPNLVARLPGAGSAPPLLLHGHVDVVAAGDPAAWAHPPFAGETHDGVLWGRGALDMKGPVAMMLAAILRAKAEGTELPGDVILAVLVDEEAGSDLGSRFLVDRHPELFAGVRFALSELGGFSMPTAGVRFHPIQVAEKQACRIRAVFRGPGGHGSLPATRRSAVGQLSDALKKLHRRRLPVHVTPPVRLMIETMAEALPRPHAATLRALLRPPLTDRILDLLGDRGRTFDALLHNTANPTIVRAGEKVNVVPGEVELRLDGRLVPGQRPEDLLRELRGLLGTAELEITRHDDGPDPDPDMGLFGELSAILRELDPAARPFPAVIPGRTDGGIFARLGIQTYGYTPMSLPPEISFPDLLHAADERVPVAAVEFGAEAMFRVLQRFGRATA